MAVLRSPIDAADRIEPVHKYWLRVTFTVRLLISLITLSCSILFKKKLSGTNQMQSSKTCSGSRLASHSLLYWLWLFKSQPQLSPRISISSVTSTPSLPLDPVLEEHC